MSAAEPFDHFLAKLEADVVGPDREMPSWLWQMAAVLFDGQDAATSTDWARRLYLELERLGGRVPFSVVHDWHAHIVAPMLAESSERRGGDVGLQRAVQQLHARALAKEHVEEAEWKAALGPALQEVYAHAYAYAEAYATARANCYAFAIANDYGEEKSADYAESYAKLNTSANERSYADAHSMANTRAAAAAYSTADAQAYAEAYPSAHVHVYAHAWANQGELAGQDERRRAAYRRLADGLTDSLARTAA